MKYHGIVKSLYILEKFKKSKLMLLGFIIIIYIVSISFYWARFDIFNFFIGTLGLLLIIVSAKRDTILTRIQKFPNYITIPCKLICCVIILSFLIVEGIIIYNMNGKAADIEKEYIVILGCQVDGVIPSIPLIRRVNIAVKYLKEYPNVKVVITGGKGPGEHITEAEAMKRILIRNGIDEKRILEEDKARSTIENLTFADELYQLTDKSIIIVTSDYHMFRSLSIAKKLGYKNVSGISSKSQLSLLPIYLLREYVAVMYYVLLGRI